MSPLGEVVVVSLVDFSATAGSDGAGAPAAPVAPVAPGAPGGPGSAAGAGTATVSLVVSVSLHPPTSVPSKNKTPTNADALPIVLFIVLRFSFRTVVVSIPVVN